MIKKKTQEKQKKNRIIMKKRKREKQTGGQPVLITNRGTHAHKASWLENRTPPPPKKRFYCPDYEEDENTILCYHINLQVVLTVTVRNLLLALCGIL